MNFDEKIARKHLEHIGFNDIVREPDGNVPPDYLLNNTIAVEVRRLNQNFEAEGIATGLEETAIPFIDGIENMLKSVEIPQLTTWFVSVFFQRPLPAVSSIREDIQRTCMDVANINANPGYSFAKPISESVYLRFTKGSGWLGKPFALGAISDFDSGGFVYDLLSANIDHCIREKTRKISKYRARYEIWWLILVDHIDYCLSKEELHTVKVSRPRENEWDKVIIVSALDPTNSFEL